MKMNWYKVNAWEELAGELRLGKVLALAWEWCVNGTTPTMWEETLRTLCEFDDIDVFFLRVERKSLTIAWNTAENPPPWAIQDAVERIEHDRFVEQPIPSKEDFMKRTQMPFVFDLSKFLP